MSAECSSFHAFNRHQQTHGTLGDYCRTVSDSLQLLSIESGICGSSNLESDSENSHHELGVGVPHPLGARYNKRDAFFGEESLKKLRRNRALNHQITKTQDGKQQSCVWCCRTKEHISGASIAGWAIRRHTRAASAWFLFAVCTDSTMNHASSSGTVL
jgi:hypothetical protein